MKEVAIGIALANVQKDIDREEMLSFLKSEGIGIDVYERTPVRRAALWRQRLTGPSF